MLSLNPRNANLFYDLGGTSYELVRRYADALRAFDQALILAPDLNDVAIEKGLIYVRWHGQLDTLRAVLSEIPADAELLGTGTLTAWRANLQFWERNPDSVLSLLQSAGPTFFDIPDYLVPAALYTAWAHRLRGDQSAARASFERSRLLLDSLGKRFPDLWEVHASRGYTLAGLGHRDEALREAKWLEQLEVYRRDAYDGPMVAEARARILAQAGDTQGALDEIERLLGKPSLLTVHMLRLDPIWDPLRSNPRFQALLAKNG